MDVIFGVEYEETTWRPCENFFSFKSDRAVYLTQYSVWLRTGRTGFDPCKRQKILPLACTSRPALGPTQPTVQWVPGVFSPGGGGKARPGQHTGVIPSHTPSATHGV
jgi:hypothetical protein